MIRILPLAIDREMFCLYEDDRLLAKCYYSSETGEIMEIDPLDPVAAKPWYAALIKATLSSLEYAGIEVAWSKNQSLFPLLKALRFEPSTEDCVSVSLKGYFDNACECHQ